MAATNSTTNYDLPQWVATDKPEMTDFNTAMADIDTNINLVQSGVNNLKSNLATTTQLWSGAGSTGGTLPLSENAFKFASLTVRTANAAGDSGFRSAITISPRATLATYYPIMYGTTVTWIRVSVTADGTGIAIIGLGHVDARVVAVIGEGRIID